jgi:predicted DCC family thiol-disulfide oxidoreductase YuxK
MRGARYINDMFKGLMDNRYIVIFDGVCNFCNGAVNFIIKRDPEGLFVFTPMQSDLAHELMVKHKIDNVGIDTFLLVKNEQCFVFSNAALEISKDLTGFWHIFNIFKFVPKVMRDYCYKMFARNRYALFGRQHKCMVPAQEVRSRFVGI